MGNKSILLRICTLAFLLCQTSLARCQDVYRSLSTANSEYDCSMEKMASIHGQLYVYGFAGSNLQFQYEKTIPTYGTHKLFVAKYSDSGQLIKTLVFGGLGANINGYACAFGKSITCYSGIYSGGYAENTTNILSSNKKGMFVTALDSSLQSIWRLFLQANDKFHCNLLCPDGKGNLYAAGYFSDSLIAGSFTFLSKRPVGLNSKAKDIFLLLISNTGIVLQAQTYGGMGNDFPTALTADVNGNALLSAVISDTVQLGDLYFPQQSNAKNIVFKTNSAGHTFWATAFSGAGVNINGLAYSKNNRIICGTNFRSSLIVKAKNKISKLNTSPDYYQLGILALDTLGNLLQYTTESSVNECTVSSLTLDAADNIYIAGEFKCTFTGLNKKNTSWSFKNIGFGDMYLAAYRPDLSNWYQRQLGGTEADHAGQVINWNNRPVICGSYEKDLQATCDSNVKVRFTGMGNYQIRGDYYLGYSPGPYRQLVSTDNAWMGTRSGFFTDLVDQKAQLNNIYQRTHNPLKQFTEDGKWRFEIFNTPNSSCGSSYLYYAWIQQYSYSHPYGTYLEYTLNGNKLTYNDLNNYRYNKTTAHTLMINTMDQCYRDTLKGTHVIIPQEYAVINYDRVKYPGNIILCKNDSICLTASNTKGLKYFWLVQDFKYVLDTGNIYNPEKKWTYVTDKIDTFWTPSICIKKRAYVNLEVEKNNICLQGRSIWTDKEKLGPNDSLVWFFEDSSTYFCKGLNTPYENFKIRILDKITGFYRYPNLQVTIKINGQNYGQSYQTNFNVPIPDTGKISVSGTVQLGCDIYNFALSRPIHLLKPKITITGELSNCHTGDRIFTADSGFKTYEWYVHGLPDTPEVIKISPWKVRIKGSMQNVSVFAYYDTTNGKECYVNTGKNVIPPPRLNIASSIAPAQLCPGTKITLNASGNTGGFSWFPGGESTQSIEVSEPGTYYCQIKDTGDCTYETNKIEVLGFFTPDILMSPDDGICPGQEAEVFVIAPASAAIKWTAPLAWGNKVYIKTAMTGIFYCDVKTCNTTYKLNVKIAPKTLDTHRLNFDINICPGQTLKLSCHDSESYAYNWIPGSSGNRSFLANAAGTYTVQARDICDNWYDADHFNLVLSSGAAKSGKLDTLICGYRSTQVDLRKKYPGLDSNYSCLWADNMDTAFQRTFAAGNSTALALIKNKFCSTPDSFHVKIKNHITPAIKIDPVPNICVGSEVRLEVRSSDTGINGTQIIWNNDLGTGPVKYKNIFIPTWFTATYKDTCGLAKDSVYIAPNLVLAQFDIAYDPINDEVILTDKSSGKNILAYAWFIDGIPNGQGNIHRTASPYSPNSLVCLRIQSAEGCSDSICKLLPVFNDGKAFIPSVFHPGSGIKRNQRFAPVSSRYMEYTMSIYNRWGQKIFDGGNGSEGWDGSYMGSPCISGTYVYLIQLKYTDIKGSIRNTVCNGTVLLID